jgi:ABC-type polysaccharide/polyol phosphate transport system ATPase subunit
VIVVENLNFLRSQKNYAQDSIKSLVLSVFSNPVENLINSKNTEHVLKNINLKINAGDKIALFGNNGSGKTTLCKMFSKQLLPTTGTVNMPVAAHCISQLENCLIDELTGRENLYFFISHIFKNKKKSELDKLLQKCISYTGIADAIDRLVETYSQGMRSRLAWSAVCADVHQFLILDELNASVDISFKKNMSTLFKNVIDNTDYFIYVSHAIDDIILQCNRGIVLDQGQIIYDGNLEKAIACYQLLKVTND